MTNPKRIPLPAGLKVGDVIVDNHGMKHAITDRDQYGYKCSDQDGIFTRFHRDGWRFMKYNGFAVRVIRKAAKKAKMNRDAAWMLDRLKNSAWASDRTARRVRAIARRLNGGAL